MADEGGLYRTMKFGVKAKWKANQRFRTSPFILSHPLLLFLSNWQIKNKNLPALKY